MPQLTDDRSTPELGPGPMVGLLGANQTIFAGAILRRNASGHLVEGATATGAVGVGRAEERKTSTSAGVTTILYRPGTFRFDNSAAGDAIGVADVGKVCVIVDDQTVARTNGSNTRSKAGIVAAVDAQGVWVRFDEALTDAT